LQKKGLLRSKQFRTARTLKASRDNPGHFEGFINTGMKPSFSHAPAAQPVFKCLLLKWQLDFALLLDLLTQFFKGQRPSSGGFL